MRVAKGFQSWVEENLASILAKHLKGIQNVLADFLEHCHVRQGKLSLHPEVFASLSTLWGQPEVDLFASATNKKVERFFSLNPHDPAVVVDALADPWKFNVCYTFSLFNLLVKTGRS